jgi:ABC-type polysaccharide/polyol phosphate export permease
MTEVFDAATGAAMPPTGGALWLARRTLRNLRKGLGWAWLDTVCQYRRSKIGPLWETINVLVMTLGMTFVSSAVIGGTVTGLIGYIGLGIIVWSAITALVLDGAGTFVRNREHILASNLSIDFYIGRTIFRAFITFCHHLVLYFIGAAVGLITLHWVGLLAIPGILLLFANGYWVVTLFALVCARFRDVELIIRNLLQLAFFVTPVFWDYRQVAKDRAFIVDYNVVFYFLEIVRAPLLGEVPPIGHYVVVLAVTVVGFLLAYVAYRRMRRRLAFFV